MSRVYRLVSIIIYVFVLITIPMTKIFKISINKIGKKTCYQKFGFAKLVHKLAHGANILFSFIE